MTEEDVFYEEKMHETNSQSTNVSLLEDDSPTDTSPQRDYLSPLRRPPRRSKFTSNGGRDPKRSPRVRGMDEIQPARNFTPNLLDAQRAEDSLADLALPLSPKGQVEHVTQEVFLIVRLALTLWSYLGLGWRWTWNCCRLVIYAMILMPGFLQMVVYYYFSPQVRRSVIYGRKPRNRLDFYIPQTESSDKAGWPVVIFITGKNFENTCSKFKGV